MGGGLKWYEKNNIKPGFDTSESIRVSKQTDCGCNYRFDRHYIEPAIFFEIKDSNHNSSIWFLLPDDKVLLYIMDGEKAPNYDRPQDGKKWGLLYHCLLLGINGQSPVK